MNKTGRFIVLEVTGSDISNTIEQLTRQGCMLYEIQYLNELTVRFEIHIHDLKIVKKITSKSGDHLKIISLKGYLWSIMQVYKRPVLLVFSVLLLALTIYIPKHIFFIEIEGSFITSEERILEYASQSGLYFGCEADKIDSNAFKNKMISKLSQCRWIGVTLSGCVATIHINENSAECDPSTPQHTVSHIIAANDGLIEDITVTDGVQMCKVGQVVHKGQVLISGYEDCGLFIRATNAQGTVYAKTSKQIDAVALKPNAKENGTSQKVTNYALLVGKKQINFSNDSSISPAHCVKIRKEKYLTLPCGFKLPIALVKTTHIAYDNDQYDSEEKDVWISDYLRTYVQSQMLAGTVLQEQLITEKTNDCIWISGSYYCTEQIGYSVTEEIMNDGRKDG